MTLFINRTQHPDTQALYAKLDGLLRTHGEAGTDLTTLDDRDVEDIEAHRKRHRELDIQANRSTQRRQQTAGRSSLNLTVRVPGRDGQF
jgi:low affinity Fe/Cu permease